MRRTIFGWLAAIALSPLFLAGDNSSVKPCPNQPDGDVLALPIRVMTQDLQVLEGLQASNFALSEGKVPLEICRVTHERQPVSVGILMDSSGSMVSTKSPRVPSAAMVARAGVAKLLDTSGPEDEYFLEYVSNVAAMHCTFSCDLRHVRAGLQAGPNGRTALIDGVYLGLHGMSKAHHANRALLVVSDGGDNHSVYRFKELERALADSPVALFLLLPAPPGALGAVGPEETEARTDLMKLVNHSGGYTLVIHDEQEAVAGMPQMAAAIRSPYVLYFGLPPSRTAESLRHLRVEVKGVYPKPRLYYGIALETRRVPAAPAR